MITRRTSNLYGNRPLAVFKPFVAVLLLAAMSLGTTMAQSSGKSPVVTYQLDEDPYFSDAPAPSGKNPVTSYGKNPVPHYGKNPISYGKEPVPFTGKNPPVFLPPSVGPLVNFHFGLDTTVYYDDNIYLSNRWKQDDVIFQIVPHLGVDIGDVDGGVDSFGILRYSPVFNIYLDNDSRNTIGGVAEAELQFRIQRLTLLAYSRFEQLNDPQPNDINRYDRNIFDNSLRAIYDISPKTNVEVGGRYKAVRYDSDPFLIDYDDWYVDGLLEYVVSDKTRVGLGYGYGRLDPERGFDQEYQRAFGRLLWYPSGKLTLEGLIGGDFRDLEIGTRNTFIYDVSLQYNPRAGTAMHLTSYRDVEPSARFIDQNYDSTGVGFKIDQRVGSRWTASLWTGYEWSNYYPVGPTAIAPRNDNYFFVRPSLAYAFRDWLSAELWYLYRNSDSTIPGFEYDNNQVGIGVQMVF